MFNGQNFYNQFINDKQMACFYSEFEKCVGSFSNNTSIAFCDNNEIVQKITYEELLQCVKILSDVLQQYIPNNCCVGVAMQVDIIFVTSLISIQKLQCAFYCFGLNTALLELNKRIDISYILVCNVSTELKQFLVDNANILNKITVLNKCVELWKIGSITTIKEYKNISYIIQTSGTTGMNKIVQVQHSCILSNIKSFVNIFKINETDVIYFGTSITFDPFIVELMLALTTGASLLIIADELKQNKSLLMRFLFTDDFNYNVTFIQMCPSVFLTFSERNIKKIICDDSSLRILTLGGEEFPSQQLFKYKNWRESLQIYNLYGITEISCWASVEKVSNGRDVSLGCPLTDTIFIIKDEFGNEIENGIGTLFIGSKTRLCIIDNENLDENLEVFRNTGDIVEKNGAKYYYKGRSNDIIKRFGYRINLSNIKKQVYDLTELDSVPLWNKDQNKLILFVVFEETNNSVKNKIIDRLKIKLLRNLSPENNPDAIEIISSIPLTENGKLDKNRLLKKNILTTSLNNSNPKHIFLNLLKKYLGRNEIDNNFINLGGNSILAIQIISEFDSVIENSYSAELMSIMMDKNKSLIDYKNLIDSYKFKIEENPTKRQKIEDSLTNLDLIDIQVHWKHDMDACVDSSPVCFHHPRLSTLVAIGSHGQKFSILNATTGELISQAILPDAVESSSCISPDKQLTIVGCNDGVVYFIEVETGEIVNRFKTGASVKSTPVLSEGKIIFGSYDGYVYCLNLQGDLEWKFQTKESIKSNVASHNKHLFIATIQGTYICLCSTTGQLKWKFESKVPVFGSPCFLDENLIWPDVKGRINSFDCKNGNKVWSYEASGFLYSSICKYKQKILFSCFDCNVYCLECKQSNCEELFKVNLGAEISTTPFLFTFNEKDYFIVINNRGTLFVFDLKDRSLQQKFLFNSEVFSSPIVVDDNIFVGCRDNYLYCMKMRIK